MGLERREESIVIDWYSLVLIQPHLNTYVLVQQCVLLHAHCVTCMEMCVSLTGNVPTDECGESQRRHIFRTLHQRCVLHQGGLLAQLQRLLHHKGALQLVQDCVVCAHIVCFLSGMWGRVEMTACS